MRRLHLRGVRRQPNGRDDSFTRFSGEKSPASARWPDGRRWPEAIDEGRARLSATSGLSEDYIEAPATTTRRQRPDRAGPPRRPFSRPARIWCCNGPARCEFLGLNRRSESSTPSSTDNSGTDHRYNWKRNHLLRPISRPPPGSTRKIDQRPGRLMTYRAVEQALANITDPKAPGEPVLVNADTILVCLPLDKHRSCRINSCHRDPAGGRQIGPMPPRCARCAPRPDGRGATASCRAACSGPRS